MEFTFGIITNGSAIDYIRQIIQSIYDLNIPKEKYEIIIVGGEPIDLENVRVIPFDEQKYKNAICRKKNLIFHEAKFPNISIGHDYVRYNPDWYSGFLKFGTDWDCCMTRILNKDGVRYRDWVTYDMSKPPHRHTIRYVDYNDLSQVKYQYISGTYYIVKKDFAIRYPLDNRLQWGQAEDILWCRYIRNFWNYKMNYFSSVQFLKNKEIWPPHLDEFNFKQNGGINGSL